MSDPKPPKPPFEPSYSVAEFCAAEGLTRTTFYKMRRQGFGPREMRIGRVIRITHRARLDWQQERENPSPKEKKRIAEDHARLQKRALHALAHRRDRRVAG